MTGFGRGCFDGEILACTVEVKSVNHRFLDLHIKIPPELAGLELKIRKFVQSKIKRGRVDLVLNIEKNDALDLSFNGPLLRAYIKALDQLKRDFEISGGFDLVQLLRIPGIMNFEYLKLSEVALHEVEEGITAAVESALEDLDHMKREEGNALREDIQKRLDTIVRELGKIGRHTQGALTAYQGHLQTRLGEILRGVPVDPNRLVQEAAFYAERSDITEELTRLQSHSQQCKSLLESEEDIGKTLDFLLQEMNRETNTILSKTSGIASDGLEIANSAILIKTEIEKMREQVQNVE